LLNNAPLWLLLLVLAVLLLLSAFFSGSETGLMAINRYRLRHTAKSGHRGARRVSRLLEQPDRLIGIILLGNNFFNILASALSTVIAIRLFGEAGILLSTVVLTLLLLIFGEVTPKTLAALHPERIAYPAALILTPLLRVFYPLVLAVNTLANGLLRLLGVKETSGEQQSLSLEELRTVVLESGVMIPKTHRTMLLSIMDLEAMTVDDIMVPRHEIVGIDLEDNWEDIMGQITRSAYTRLLVHRGDVDQVVGFLHMRQVVNLMMRKPDFNREDLVGMIREPYFIPEGTQLHIQLQNFQQQRRGIGLVVDEYGDVMGLVTLADLLEQIIGQVTHDPTHFDLTPLDDGSYLVDAGMSPRALNRLLNWQLPTGGPKTVGGLVLEVMESIPEPGTCMLINDHPVEVVKTANNRLKTVIIKPALQRRHRSAGD